MVRYNVNGEYLVQFANEPFAVTKQIGKMGDIGTRHGDYSINFSVPICNENNKILRYITEIEASLDTNSFDRYDGFIEEDSAVISTGFFRVTKIDIHTKKIYINFYGGNTSIFDLLKNRTLNEEITANQSDYPYYLDELNHFYNFADVTGSFTNTDKYIYYPYICDKNIDEPLPSDDIAGRIDVTYFNVGFYQHWLVKNMFDSLGVTLKGSLFSDPDYYSAIIANNTDIDRYRERNTIYDYEPNILREYEYNKERIMPKDGSWVKLNYYNARVGTPTDAGWDGATFTADSDADFLGFDFRLGISAPSTYLNQVGDVEARLSYTLNGVPQTPLTISLDLNNDFYGSNWPVGNGEGFRTTFATNIVQGFSINAINQIKEGDTFTIEVRNVGNTSAEGVPEMRLNSIQRHTDPSTVSFVTVKRDNAIKKIIAKTMLPNITQSNFFKDVLVRGGAVCSYDAVNRTLYVDKMETIENNIPNARDWSNKVVDLDKNLSIDYTKLLDKYGQKSYLRYTDLGISDPYVYSRGVFNGIPYGDGIIDIENKNLDKDKTIYTSPFSACSQVMGWDDGLYAPYIPLYKKRLEQDENDSSVFHTFYDFYETNHRILTVTPDYPFLNVNSAGQSGLYIKDDDNYNDTQQRFLNIPFAYFSKTSEGSENVTLNNNLIDQLKTCLSFENRVDKGGIDLITKNYSLQKDILNKPLYLSLYFNLSPLDVQDVDFLTPIYLEFNGNSGYWYIDNIEQYKGNNIPTKVNLVKIS